jgi:hypothetical protein
LLTMASTDYVSRSCHERVGAVIGAAPQTHSGSTVLCWNWSGTQLKCLLASH